MGRGRRRARPARGDALVARGLEHHQAGRLAEAARHYEQVLAQVPDHPRALELLGLAAQAGGDAHRAEVLLGRAASLPGAHPTVHTNYGVVLSALGRYREAAGAHRAAIALDGGYAMAYSNLGNALRALGEDDEALASYTRAVTLDPDYVDARFNLAQLLFANGDAAGAVVEYERVSSLQPGHRDAALGHAMALKALGRLDEARKGLARVVAEPPVDGLAWYQLARLSRYAGQEPEIATMRELADDEEVARDDRTYVMFALAKALRDAGAYEEASRVLVEANRRHRATLGYDVGDDERLMARIAGVFDAPRIECEAGAGHGDETPVFIVGMPRSGTTLVEQILASHPRVHGAGELVELEPAIAAQAATGNGFPEGIAAIGQDGWAAIGRRYVERLRRHDSSALRITDKLPRNFLLVGAIRLALPRARIVHCTREPGDVLLSCFETRFAGAIDYAYDLSDLRRFHRAYRALMTHWARLFPGALLEVRYEDVVGDLEGQARRLVEHCGLPWDDACLAFHRSERVVRTASDVQVRQPVHDGSVGRWRRYAPWLEGLAGHDDPSRESD